MEDSTQIDNVNKDDIHKFQSVASELKDKHSSPRLHTSRQNVYLR